MKVLVTGGAGFQGSHIIGYLLGKNHEVTILNTFSETSIRNIKQYKDKITVVWGSVTDYELVAKTVREHDLVVHLAARIHVDESIEDPGTYIDVNVGGTYNVLEAIRKLDKQKPRLIYWGTCEVYGEPVKGKLSERSELRPQSPYAASKAAADRLCYAYYRTYGINITIVRLFNIFGERQKFGVRGALIPTLVERAIKKETLIISGSGRQTRDYLYIDDVVESFKILLTHNNLAGRVVNFASGSDTSVKEIAQYIGKKFHVPIKHGQERPGEVMRFPADISLARKLSFKPTVSIWQGIDRYINWRLQQ